nr:RNA-directed DNA polymerase, eukaryota [Tanacetum cinerariifolium]
EFDIDERIIWVDIEGIPLKLWSENTFNMITAKWGKILYMENLDVGCFHCKRICILTTGKLNIFESFKIIYQGKGYWVRAKETTGWFPEFDEQNEDNSDSEDDQSVGTIKEDFGGSDGEMEGENNVSVVSDTVREEENVLVEVEGNDLKENNFDDPFNLYPLLNKKKNTEKSNNTESIQYPPRFTPCDVKAAGLDKNTTGINKSSRVRGLNPKAKKDWVKEICVSHKVKFLTLQETKMESITLFDVKCCWDNFAFDHVYSPVVGNSGGILCVWEKSSFKKLNSTVSDYCVMIRGTWNGEVIVIGDFNEVRYKNERYGSVFHAHGADAFNSLISNANLQEIPLGGCAFTWCHRSASKMSKLDRFLMSEGLLSANPSFSAITLDRYLSDHTPIMLRESFHDYGPIPFRSFHYWFEIDGFEEMISKAWCESPSIEVNPMLKLIYKMKLLKKRIHEWNGMRQSSKSKKGAYKKELHDLETIIDQGNATDDMLYKRMEIIKAIQEVDKVDNMEAAQKAKIKWAIKGDENTKYYHGILNKKRNQLAIRGVLKDGIWIENPNLVKSEFLLHFKNRFQKPCSVRPVLYMTFPRQLSAMQQIDMESDVSYQEIKRAVWDCGVDKSPGPNGFTFGFIRRFCLHLSFKRVEEAGMFNGIMFNSSMILSHMFYADDAIFMGQWSNLNIDTLIYMLKCFQRASGLSINLSKSNLMGIAVSVEKVEEVAKNIGCGVLKTPFSFLGSKVGGCMSRIKSWDEVMKKMVNRLSKWKMKTLSIEGRLTILKAVLGSMPIYHMSIFKVPMSILQHKGGLGVSSLFALNRALMFKWVWRFFNQKDSLWAKVMQAIHGVDGRIGRDGKAGHASICGFEFEQWRDMLESLDGVLLSLVEDRWKWVLNGSGVFTVASARQYIDNKRLPRTSSKTRWIKEVPIKVNTHAWKVSLDGLPTRWNISRRDMDISSILCPLYGLPTRWNISRRGMDISSILCPLCELAVETSKHLFFECTVVKDIFRKICNWWDVSNMEIASFDDWASWILNLRLSSKHKRLLEG